VAKTAIFLLVFVIFLSACRVASTPSKDTIKIHPELQNIPVYTVAKGWVIGIPGIDTPQG